MTIDYSKWDKIVVSSDEESEEEKWESNKKIKEEGAEDGEMKDSFAKEQNKSASGIKTKRQNERSRKPRVTRFDCPQKVEISKEGYEVLPCVSSVGSSLCGAQENLGVDREKKSEDVSGNEEEKVGKKKNAEEIEIVEEKLKNLVRNGSVVISKKENKLAYLWNQSRYNVNILIVLPRFVKKAKCMSVEIKQESLTVFYGESCSKLSKASAKEERGEEEERVRKMKIFEEKFYYDVDVDEEKWVWEIKSVDLDLSFIDNFCGQMYGGEYCGVSSFLCESAANEKGEDTNVSNAQDEGGAAADDNDDDQEESGRKSQDEAQEEVLKVPNNQECQDEYDKMLEEYYRNDIKSKENRSFYLEGQKSSQKGAKEERKIFLKKYQVLEINLQKKNDLYGISIWWPSAFKGAANKIPVTKIPDRNKTAQSTPLSSSESNPGNHTTNKNYNFLDAWNEAHKRFKQRVREKVTIEITEQQQKTEKNHQSI